MTWTADVPFPAEDITPCKGCPAQIGWVTRQTDDGERPHPVEIKGWVGVAAPPGTKSGFKAGYTLEGEHRRIVEGEALLPGDRIVLFESHFGFCPKRTHFQGRHRG